jgi:RND family efflux transporter MFP subunit
LVVLALAGAALLLAAVMFMTSPAAVARREREAALAPTRADRALPAVASSTSLENLLPVEAQMARRRAEPIAAEISAALSPIRSVELAAEIGGRVVAVPADEHEVVAEGAVLLEFERTFLTAALERARAQLLRAQASHGLATTELERQRDLAERNVASTADLDRAKNQERAAYAGLLEARAALSDARTRLEKATIRAPFAGVVNTLDLEPGAYLQPGQPVAELLDLSAIEVEFGVTDREVVALEVGDPVELRVDVFPEEWFPGTIAHIGRAADDRTQKYPVQAHVPNADTRLLASMLGQVRFWIGSSQPAIRIPRRAVRRESELDYVFVLEGDPSTPTAHRRRVTTRPVPFRPDLVEVTQGLQDAERVAVSGIRELREGLRVRVRGNAS